MEDLFSETAAYIPEKLLEQRTLPGNNFSVGLHPVLQNDLEIGTFIFKMFEAYLK
ncbi:hypothetical protein [Pedobacter kyonggii]|uniref:hypothetical protein n=1 Tax=Pedobacter kyonggii TaxID=1926871 RepID=UPI0013EF5284|nr:hypothetical protein [Pedobacter kyonggii]